MVAACEGVVVHSTGRSHVESIAVGSDGRVAVASSALTGDLWDGRIQLLRCGSGAASAARTATAAPAAPDGAATQLGSIETGVGSCDVAWLSSSLLVCADDRRPLGPGQSRVVEQRGELLVVRRVELLGELARLLRHRHDLGVREQGAEGLRIRRRPLEHCEYCQARRSFHGRHAP